LWKRCCTATAPEFRGATCRNGFGDWKNTYQRFSRWAKNGVWQRPFEHLAADANNEYAMINSTIVRAHQHSADAQLAQDRLQRGERALLVGAHQPRVARHIGGKNGREPALDPLCAQRFLPTRRPDF
jgi:hypothetical protein